MTLEPTSDTDLEEQVKSLQRENLALQKELAIKNVISEISKFQANEGKLTFIYKRIFTLLSEIIHIENFYIALIDDNYIHIPFIVDKHDKFSEESLHEKTNPDMRRGLTGYALTHFQSMNLNESDILKLQKEGELEVVGSVPKQWIFFPFYAENLQGGLVTQSYRQENKYSYTDMSILAYVTMHVGNFLSAYKSKEKIRQQYEELKSAQSQLVHSEKMASVGQLAAGVAHEINNPLGYVNSNLNSLKEYVTELGDFINETGLAISDLKNNEDLVKKIDALKDKYDIAFILSDAQELVSESIFGMDKVKKIIQSLKNFTHAGEEKMKKANINTCLEETIRIVWNELKYHCQVKKNLTELPETYCHPSQLNQVFMNLLINAGHAITEKGVITVSTQCKNKTIIIKVQDNGKGIEKEHLSQLFNPFFTTKPVGQGTGLGLSISYGIIETHSGKITVESEVGKGTCFTIELPVVDEIPEDSEVD